MLHQDGSKLWPNMSTRRRSPVGLLFLALAAAGGLVAFAEARPYFSGGVLASERFQAIAEDRLTPGPSTASQRLVLDSCLDAITSIYGRTQPAARRAAVHRTCMDLADRIVAVSPTHSYAWFIGALAAEHLDDLSGMSSRLARSQATGPTEQWIAELRVDLAERHLAALQDDARGGHDRDLAMLVASDRGVRTIARRYARDQSFRNRIVPLIETMSMEQQRRFLRSIAAVVGRLDP